MTPIFQDIHMIILVEFMPLSVTVTAAAYQVSLKCLREAIQCCSLGLLTLGVLLLHINVRLHTSHNTIALLDTWHWEHVPHPRYSPQLDPLRRPHVSKRDTFLRSVTSICQQLQSQGP